MRKEQRVKKRQKAVALKYNPGVDTSPIIIASGSGLVADQIIHIGEEHGVPVYRDDSAASMLCMLELGSGLPEELYGVIANIYVEIMKHAKQLENE